MFTYNLRCNGAVVRVTSGVKYNLASLVLVAKGLFGIHNDNYNIVALDVIKGYKVRQQSHCYSSINSNLGRAKFRPRASNYLLWQNYLQVRRCLVGGR